MNRVAINCPVSNMGWFQSFMILPMPPPNGTVHWLPLEACQSAVRMGCQVMYCRLQPGALVRPARTISTMPPRQLAKLTVARKMFLRHEGLWPRSCAIDGRMESELRTSSTQQAVTGPTSK